MDGHDKIYPIQTFYYNEKEKSWQQNLIESCLEK